MMPTRTPYLSGRAPSRRCSVSVTNITARHRVGQPRQAKQHLAEHLAGEHAALGCVPGLQHAEDRWCDERAGRDEAAHPEHQRHDVEVAQQDHLSILLINFCLLRHQPCGEIEPVTEIRAAAQHRARFSVCSSEQSARNQQLLKQTPTLGESEIRSEVLPFALDLKRRALSDDADVALAALEKTAATIAIESLISLAKVNDIDHLGGGLELIGPLLMTLGAVDYRGAQFSIEHGHTSIGYYAALAALGFLPRERVIDEVPPQPRHRRPRVVGARRHADRLRPSRRDGAGQRGLVARAARPRTAPDALVICHCGDAGWISGQALNGFIGASLHGAPIAFVMHRNGIQLSGTTARIMNKDPRPIVTSLGIEMIEIASLHERRALFGAYAHAVRARSRRASRR